MSKSLKPLLFSLFLIGNVFTLQAIDLWQFPEMAEENSLFVSVLSPSLTFRGGFVLSPPVFSVDYMLPLFLPFSVGFYIKAPSPNLTSFGVRAGYHINLDDPKTDLYFLYQFDFGFVRNDLLEKYNDKRQPVRLYDFRVGVRRLFSKKFGISLESDYKFEGLIVGLTLKLF